MSAITEAATALIEEGYRAVAALQWSRQMDDEKAINLCHGRLIGINKAIKLLEGKGFSFIIPPTYLDGKTLVAVNLLGEGLYRTFYGGQLQHYRYSKDSGLRETNNIDKWGWLWLDPSHPTNATEE